MDQALTSEEKNFYNGIDQRVTRLETKLDAMAGQMHSIASSVERLTSSMSERGKPNWQVWIAAAGLMIVILSGIAGTVLAPIYLRTAVNQSDITDIRGGIQLLHESIAEASKVSLSNRTTIDQLDRSVWKLERDNDRLHPRMHIDEGEAP